MSLSLSLSPSFGRGCIGMGITEVGIMNERPECIGARWSAEAAAAAALRKHHKRACRAQRNAKSRGKRDRACKLGGLQSSLSGAGARGSKGEKLWERSAPSGHSRYELMSARVLNEYGPIFYALFTRAHPYRERERDSERPAARSALFTVIIFSCLSLFSRCQS